MDRHTRQMRLAEVGPEGQARIARAVVDVPGTGLAAEVAARYLAGAGVACVRVQDPSAAAAARALDASVRVERIGEGEQEDGKTGSPLGRNQILPVFPSSCFSSEDMKDPIARELATGALLALEALKAALRHGS